MLQGYSQLILNGALVTLELAVSSVLLAVAIGLLGAAAKLSRSSVLTTIFEGYTTLIRGVPDLVLMLLIFYGLQMVLNQITDLLGWSQFNIDPLVAGVITLGLSMALILRKRFAVPLWLYQKVRSKRQRRWDFPPAKFSAVFCSQP